MLSPRGSYEHYILKYGRKCQFDFWRVTLNAFDHSPWTLRGKTSLNGVNYANICTLTMERGILNSSTCNYLSYNMPWAYSNMLQCAWLLRSGYNQGGAKCPLVGQKAPGGLLPQKSGGLLPHLTLHLCITWPPVVHAVNSVWPLSS